MKFKKNLRDTVTGRGLLQTRDKPVQESRAKNYDREKLPKRDRNIRTPFRDKARDHSTERVTGAEVRKRTRCYRCRQLGHMARVSESSTEGRSPIFSKEFLFARRCLCTIA